MRIQEAWAKVQGAAIEGAPETRRIDDATTAITKLKAQIKDIIEAIRGLFKTTRVAALLLYALVLQRGASQLKEMLVLARRLCEVTIALGKETAA